MNFGTQAVKSQHQAELAQKSATNNHKPQKLTKHTTYGPNIYSGN